MLLASIKQFFSLRADRPGGILYVLIGLGLVLLLLDQVERYHEHRTERVRWAAQRAVLLDSVQRTQEAGQQLVRRQQDDELTTRYEHEAVTTKKLRQQDEQVEARYRANRITLPAY